MGRLRGGGPIYIADFVRSGVHTSTRNYNICCAIREWDNLLIIVVETDFHRRNQLSINSNIKASHYRRRSVALNVKFGQNGSNNRFRSPISMEQPSQHRNITRIYPTSNSKLNIFADGRVVTDFQRRLR